MEIHGHCTHRLYGIQTVTVSKSSGYMIANSVSQSIDHSVEMLGPAESTCYTTQVPLRKDIEACMRSYSGDKLDLQGEMHDRYNLFYISYLP